jgi:GT2 family glycosyltransferase
LAFVDAASVVDPDWLDAAVTAAADHGADAVGSPIYARDGGLLRCGRVRVDRHGHARAVPAFAAGRVLAAPFSGLVVRRQSFAAADGFDPSLAGAYDDVDLGWRLTMSGRLVISQPAAGLFTDESILRPETPTPGQVRQFECSALSLLFKTVESALLPDRMASAIIASLERATGQLPDRDLPRLAPIPPDGILLPKTSLGVLAGLDDFVRRLPLLGASRAAVQQNRQLDDGALDALLAPCTPESRKDEDSSQIILSPNAPATGSVEAAPGDNGPEVSVIVLTTTGPRHLPACLASLGALDFPEEKREVIVVDNGSPEDPTAAVRTHYPSARMIRLERNLGFCGGNNVAAREARGRWLIFLNDDTRVERDMIGALLDTARRRSARAVGALVLAWDGRSVDFAGGEVNFEGKGFQVGLGARDVDRWRTERPLFFPCGAAMLVDRQVFLDNGGFPESYFAYYEDVALGWRLRAMGHDVWLSPAAVVYHVHHGTSGDRSLLRTRLCEANGLQTVFAALEDRHLGRALTSALLLAVARVLLGAGLADQQVEGGPAGRLRPTVLWSHARHALVRRGAARRLGAVESLRTLGLRGVAGSVREVLRFAVTGATARAGWRIDQALAACDQDACHRLGPAPAAVLLGLADWLRMLPGQRARRERWQRQRVRSDAEILGPFAAHWANAVPAPAQPFYDARQQFLLNAFEIASIARPNPPAASARQN